MEAARIRSLQGQTDFLAACLDSFLEATGRKQEPVANELDPDNVAYQGRVLVSFLTLVPACLWTLKKAGIPPLSPKAKQVLVTWLKGLMRRAGLLRKRKFLSRMEFKKKEFLGSGGLARFRDTLWAAALGSAKVSRLHPESRAKIASDHRAEVESKLLTQ
jgi:hypothetical protein